MENTGAKLADFKWGKHPSGLILSLLLLLILFLAAWRSINYISARFPSSDSIIFSSIATHMMNGRVLYRETWDHKPPMIYLIDLWAMVAGDGTINSVRFAERLFAVAGTFLLFWIVTTIFKSKWLAFFAALFFLVHQYHPDTFARGNFSEEYGAVFLIGGMWAAFMSQKLNLKFGMSMSFACGFLLSLAVLCKEPFALSALPWFIYIAWPRNGKWKQAFIHAGVFIGGAVTPVVVLGIWLLSEGALMDWINATRFSFAYAATGGRVGVKSSFDLFKSIEMTNEKMAGALAITRIAAGLGVASVLSPSFVKKHDYWPVAIFACAITSYIAVCLAGRYLQHYYMQLVPVYILLGICGLAFVFELFRRAEVKQITVVFIILGSLVFTDGMKLKNFVHRLAEPSRRWVMKDPLTQYVRANTLPTDTIWSPFPGNTYLYMTTGRLSPTKWLCVFDHYFIDTPDSTAQEKLAELRKDLEQNQPRIVIVNRKWGSFIERHGLSNWLESNYENVGSSKGGGVKIWRLRQ